MNRLLFIPLVLFLSCEDKETATPDTTPPIVDENCESGFSQNGICLNQSDLDVLQVFIDNSSETINMYMDDNGNGVIELLELGIQEWTGGMITELDCSWGDARDWYICGISGLIPPEIGSMTNLTTLDLHSNELTGVIPEEICNQGDSTPQLANNKLCPPYPDCLSEEDIGEQDTTNCGD